MIIHKVVFTAVFNLVHRRIGIHNQLIDGVTVAGIAGNAHADTDKDLPVVEDKSRIKGRQDLIGIAFNRVRLAFIGDQNQKLIAAEAANHHFFISHRLQPTGNLLE